MSGKNLKKALDDAQPLAHSATVTTKKNPHAVAMGRLGGKVSGKCKARTPEQARRAAMKRWHKKVETK